MPEISWPLQQAKGELCAGINESVFVFFNDLYRQQDAN